MAQAHLDRLSAIDAGFLAQEGPTTHMHIGGVVTLDGPAPPYDEFVAHVRSRLHLVPRYRQKVAKAPLETGLPLWIDDPSFNLGYHIRHTALPSPGSRDALMTLAARLAHVRRVPAGAGVSYGLTYTVEADTTLGLVPLGYGDGVPRHASWDGRRSGEVLVVGARRRIAGRVCMDQVVVDLGDDPADPGDLALFFGPGDAGEATADDWAAAAGTISWEIVTRGVA